MPTKDRDISQNLLDDVYPRIHLQENISEFKLPKEFFDEFFEGYPSQRVVGLAPIYSATGNLTQLAIGVKTRVTVIKFANRGKNATYHGRDLLATELLCHPDVTLVAFDLDKLAVALFVDLKIRITNGVDLQSACGIDRTPLAAIKYAACDCVPVQEENVKNLFDCKNIMGQTRTAMNAALQAWVAQCISSMNVMDKRVRSAKKITTQDRPDEHGLCAVVQIARSLYRAELLRADEITHKFHAVDVRNQTANVRADCFDSRFIKGAGMQRLIIRDLDAGVDFPTDGTIDSVNGRDATIVADASLEGRTIMSISTSGSNGPTSAERLHRRAVLQALQGNTDDYFQSPFLKYIFKSSPNFQWPKDFPISDSLPDLVSQRPLNDSQQLAVRHMLMNTEETRLTIIQGPPGTGKTTVIAAFVCTAVAAGQSGLWLMAKSNNAVRNIAEKLVDIGFSDFRLLVSKGFCMGWHDHLYTSINKNVILSDQLKGAQSRIHGVSVILCTLDMLAHPSIHICTTANPITTAIIDEAGQIPVGSYVTPFSLFSSSIKKVCMVGDDKQLPPFDAGKDSTIQSIFEIKHLRSDIKLLNIQYRMPPFIGKAISNSVYDGQLQSNPGHPLATSEPSCWFVHVDGSQECKSDTSWKNPREQAVVLKISQRLQEEGKKYCVITPYEAQRTLIEEGMMKSGLIWQEKCFNVDTFQGNEKDYIVVSLTRSKSLGFLKDLRRSNVMLTRCKRGMYIVTSWEFVHGVAADTLVGRMSEAWGERVWVHSDDVIVKA